MCTKEQSNYKHSYRHHYTSLFRLRLRLRSPPHARCGRGGRRVDAGIVPEGVVERIDHQRHVLVATRAVAVVVALLEVARVQRPVQAQRQAGLVLQQILPVDRALALLPLLGLS